MRSAIMASRCAKADDGKLPLRLICALVLGVLVGSTHPAGASHCEGDTLCGGGGDDTIVGSGCDDLIVGNDGNNELRGQRGHDLFIFSTGCCRGLEWQAGWFQPRPLSPDDCPFDSPFPFFPAFGVSDVADFTHGFDRIALDKATFTALKSEIGFGLSDPTEFHTVDADAAVEADSAVIVYSAESQRLFYNENGPAAGFGKGGPFATLEEITSLDASDFQVIDWTVIAPPSTATTTSITTTTMPGVTTTTMRAGVTTTTTLRETTSTTLLCTTAQCVVQRAVTSPACSDETIPKGITVRLNRALSLIGTAATSSPKKAEKVRKTAGRLLKKAANAASKAARAKRPKLSAECAGEIQRGGEGVRGILGV